MSVDNFDIYKWNFNRRLLENEENKNKYIVQYWLYRNDDYDDYDIEVEAKSEEEAIEKAKEEAYKGKKHKVIAVNGKYKEEN